MSDDTSVNDQITDAVNQANASVAGASAATAHAMAQQMMAQAIGLAMQNAVHQQQQRYILRNAATSAASRAIMQGDPEKAMALAKEMLDEPDIGQTLSELKRLMDDIAKPSPSAAKKTNSKPARKKKASRKKAAKRKD